MLMRSQSPHRYNEGDSLMRASRPITRLLALILIAAALPGAASAQAFVAVGSLGARGEFNIPAGAATDAAGDVFVADPQQQRTEVHRRGDVPDGGAHGSGDGQFFNPAGVATNVAGEVYVVDQVNAESRSSPAPALSDAVGLERQRMGNSAFVGVSRPTGARLRHRRWRQSRVQNSLPRAPT
jgi:hypothetical protein